MRDSLELQEEFGLEGTAEKGVRLLRRPDTEREPIILQRGAADVLEGSEWYSAFGGYIERIVHDTLNNNMY